MSPHLALLVALLSTAASVVLDRCSLARELSQRHLIPWQDVATWVCIARHESDFNTSAVGHMDGESGDHGIFQISDRYWCSPPGVGKSCGLACALLEDEDLSDDVSCALRIHQEHERLAGDGFTAWVVYRRFCLGDVSEYVRGCEDTDLGPSSSPPPPTSLGPASLETTLADTRGIQYSSFSTPPSLKTTFSNDIGRWTQHNPTISIASDSRHPSLKNTLSNNREKWSTQSPASSSNSPLIPPKRTTMLFNSRETFSTYNPTTTTSSSRPPLRKTWYKDRGKYNTYKSTYTSFPLKPNKIPRGKKLSEYSDSLSQENYESTSESQSRPSGTGLNRRPSDLYPRSDLDPRTAWYRIHYDPRFLDEFP